MTDLELSSLMSELTKTAKMLNDESNGINGVIRAFEDTLCKLNLGLEVWLRVPIDNISDDDDHVDLELGFTKVEDAWHLAVRPAEDTDDIGRLLEQPRAIRVAAIAQFKSLAELMLTEANLILRAIEEAKKLVK
jgi:hypothetical protein